MSYRHQLLRIVWTGSLLSLASACSALFTTDPGGATDESDAALLDAEATDAFVAGSCRDRESFENSQLPSGWLFNEGDGTECIFQSGNSACGEVNLECSINAGAQGTGAWIDVPITSTRAAEVQLYLFLEDIHPADFMTFVRFTSDDGDLGEAFIDANGIPGVFIPGGRPESKSTVALLPNQWWDLRIQILNPGESRAVRLLSGDAKLAEVIDPNIGGTGTFVTGVQIGIPVAAPTGDEAHLHIDGVGIRSGIISDF